MNGFGDIIGNNNASHYVLSTLKRMFGGYSVDQTHHTDINDINGIYRGPSQILKIQIIH